MCTAISWQGSHHFFGRNLDLEYSYPAQICVAPRHFSFSFRQAPAQTMHYAMIGTATVSEGFPLFYEATNECGLSAAGLNFPQNAFYPAPTPGSNRVAPFELIPWLLGQCRDTAQARLLLEKTEVVSIAFSKAYPISPLHWLIADRHGALVVESTQAGLAVYDDPVGVLTNSPVFPMQLQRLADFMHLSPRQPENLFSPSLPLPHYSNGMGAMGLPGDFSSMSRFVKASFLRQNSIGTSICEDICHFFHLLQAVAMPMGSVIMPDGRPEITRYSCCCDTDTGIYYYTTCRSGRICAIDLHRAGPDGAVLTLYPMEEETVFYPQN